jgi:hypothetical protein
VTPGAFGAAAVPLRPAFPSGFFGPLAAAPQPAQAGDVGADARSSPCVFGMSAPPRAPAPAPAAAPPARAFGHMAPAASAFPASASGVGARLPAVRAAASPESPFGGS